MNLDKNLGTKLLVGLDDARVNLNGNAKPTTSTSANTAYTASTAVAKAMFNKDYTIAHSAGSTPYREAVIGYYYYIR